MAVPPRSTPATTSKVLTPFIDSVQLSRIPVSSPEFIPCGSDYIGHAPSFVQLLQRLRAVNDSVRTWTGVQTERHGEHSRSQFFAGREHRAEYGCVCHQG